MHFWKHLEYPKTPDLCTCTNYIVKQIKPGSATKEATGQIQNFTELARQICYQIVHMLFPIPSLDIKPLIWSILPHLRNHTKLVLPNGVIFTTDTWKHLLILPESQLWTWQTLLPPSPVKYFYQLRRTEYTPTYMLVKNCPEQCSGGTAQRLLEITGISFPAVPMMTHLQIKFGSTGMLENMSHKATSGLWPLGWGSCENDSAADLFLNCRITPKPRILTNLHLKNKSC